MQDRATIERTIENLYGRKAKLNEKLETAETEKRKGDIVALLFETSGAIETLKWVLGEQSNDASLARIYSGQFGS